MGVNTILVTPRSLTHHASALNWLFYGESQPQSVVTNSNVHDFSGV